MEGLALFAAPAQSLEISTRFKGEKSRRLSRQEKAKVARELASFFVEPRPYPSSVSAHD